MKALVTGTTGFVGRRVALRLLTEHGISVRSAGRRLADLPPQVEQMIAEDLGSVADWRPALAGCDVVLHVAGRAHILREHATDSLAAFRAVNVNGTLRLARQAAESGVRRFVFVSSVKVNGGRTSPGRPFRAEDPPAPVEPYAVSKHEAEVALQQIARETGLEVVIVRPVLVYGPGVGANFHSMLRWVRAGVPLPLGGLHNRRSLIAVENLADLLARCALHPAAAGHTLMASDGEDVSTTELLRRSARFMGKRARLVPVPAGMLEHSARLLGRSSVAERLCGWLQVDAAPTRALLEWAPPRSFDDALRETVAAFVRAGGRSAMRAVPTHPGE